MELLELNMLLSHTYKIWSSNIEIPVNGTLVKLEQDYIYCQMGVKLSVRYRNKNKRRAMSAVGPEAQIEKAVDTARRFMEHKLRIDVCKCVGFQNELKTGEIRKIT